uniref:Uncharacterized protein n=1 Tax=Tetranychus urticae TaxID=32264 RepID=T1KJR0_TETUR
MKIYTLKPDFFKRRNLHRNVDRQKQPAYSNDRSRFMIFRLSQFFTYFGLISSLIIVISNYIAFRVTTKVDIRTYKKATLPSISVCFFYDIDPKYGPTIQESADHYHATRLTVKQINDLLPTWDQFVPSCLIVVPGFHKPVSCTHLDPNISEYLNLYSKCFRIFDSSFNKLKYQNYHHWGNQLVEITINKSVLTTSKIGVFLNNPTSGLENAMGNPSFIQFDTSENNQASITFKRIKIKSKPYPYVTDCFDYTQLDCKQRIRCIHSCVGELHLAVKNEWSYRRYIKLIPQHYNARFSDRPELSFLSTYCFNKYPQQPCTQMFYLPELGTQINSPFKENGSYHILINYPHGTEKIIKYFPGESFVNFLVHLTSVIGIWIFLPTIRALNILFYWTFKAFNFHQNVKKKLKLSHSSLKNGWLSHKSHPIRTRNQLSHAKKMSTRNAARIAW